MASLVFPIVKDELLVDVRVNLHAPALVALQAAHQTAPQSLVAKALIDNGSNVTCVSSAIIQHFSPKRHAQSTSQGIAGPISVDLYHVSLSIFDNTQLQLPWFTHPDLLVMELPSGLAVDVLIGMDVLFGCRMLVDGPSRLLMIDF
jgi:hypothetical protein